MQIPSKAIFVRPDPDLDVRASKKTDRAQGGDSALIRHTRATGTCALELALAEPLSIGDVYQAKTNSVEFWAMGRSKEFGNRALLGLPSLIRRLDRSKSAHEYVKTSLYAIPAVVAILFWKASTTTV